jgi:hypothetical protein
MFREVSYIWAVDLPVGLRAASEQSPDNILDEARKPPGCLAFSDVHFKRGARINLIK